MGGRGGHAYCMTIVVQVQLGPPVQLEHGTGRCYECGGELYTWPHVVGGGRGQRKLGGDGGNQINLITMRPLWFRWTTKPQLSESTPGKWNR